MPATVASSERSNILTTAPISWSRSSFVATPAALPKFRAVAAEAAGPLEFIDGAKFATALDAEIFQLFGHDFAHAGDFFKREVFHEGLGALGWDGELAVGLSPVASDFCEKFIWSDARRGGETGFGENVGADFFGHLGAVIFMMADIEKSFVERKRLDEVGVAGKNRADLLAVALVNVKSGGDDFQMWTFFQSHENGHGRAATEFPRLVICGRQHPAAATTAHPNRMAAQLRKITFFNSRIKTIHVDMDDFSHSRVHGGLWRRGGVISNGTRLEFLRFGEPMLEKLIVKKVRLSHEYAMKMQLQLPARRIDFPRRPLIMGIVNVNDDSFSGDGTLDPTEALAQAEKLIAEGADCIDFGAESARTNRAVISVENEITRFHSVLKNWPDFIKNARPADKTQVFPPILSANTWRPEVVEKVLPLGVELLNDMSALPGSKNAEICAVHRCALLIMHSVGQPKIAHTHQRWQDLMSAMLAFFEEKMALARDAGLSNEQLILDPGLDFAKQCDDNLLVLRELKMLQRFERPILLPLSRKTFIGDILDLADPRERDAGSVGAMVHGYRQGAQIFRMHNVRAAWQTIKMLEVLESKMPQ